MKLWPINKLTAAFLGAAPLTEMVLQPFPYRGIFANEHECTAGAQQPSIETQVASQKWKDDIGSHESEAGKEEVQERGMFR